MAKKITTDNFESEVLKSDKPVLVDFYADWCGPCKMMAPVVEELAEQFEGKAVVGKLNTDENVELRERYGVMSIPTFILFKNGEVKNTIMGVQSKTSLIQLIESNV